MFCLKIVKYVMEQLIVILHIPLASRYKSSSKIQNYDRPFEAKIVVVKLYLCLSTALFMICTVGKLKLENCYYMLRIVAQDVCKIKMLNYFSTIIGIQITTVKDAIS